MNVRKGIKRLAIAVGIPYFGFWLLYGIGGYRTGEYTQTELSKAEISEIQYEVLLNMNAEANEMVADAVLWGVFWPLIALIVGGIVFWVYRGFKSKA